MTINYGMLLSEVQTPIYKMYFMREVKPTLDRLGWVVYWGNGGVGCDNAKGQCVADTPTFLKIERCASKTFRTGPGVNSLWDVLCSLGNMRGLGVYGKWSTPCYRGAPDERRRNVQ